jgi:cytochrome c-type biogenesis protein CcmH
MREVSSNGLARRVLLGSLLFVAALAGLLAAGILVDSKVPPQEPGVGEYVERLESHLRSQPRDARGWVLLARAYAENEQFMDAARAYEKAIESPKVARDPGVLCEFADVLGIAHGRLEGRPSELIQQALAIDPRHATALEMAGSAAYEQHDYLSAAKYWKRLLGVLEPGTEQHRELAAAVARAERKAAVALPRA